MQASPSLEALQENLTNNWKSVLSFSRPNSEPNYHAHTKEIAPFSGFYPFRRHNLDHLEKEEKDTVDCKAPLL